MRKKTVKCQGGLGGVVIQRVTDVHAGTLVNKLFPWRNKACSSSDSLIAPMLMLVFNFRIEFHSAIHVFVELTISHLSIVSHLFVISILHPSIKLSGVELWIEMHCRYSLLNY